MRQSEPDDYGPNSFTLLAESKHDRSPLGTMRIQTNHAAPLRIAQSVELPEWISGSMANANRLAVVAGERGRTVKMGLFKAFYLLCLREGVEWMVVAARKPLDRQYAALRFRDVFGQNEFIPLAHAMNIPHRVMAFDVGGADQQWREHPHPLREFMMLTDHPDINVNVARPHSISNT
ncbi:hypothetical protein BGC_00450 [Burkholderia sp. 3C]